MMNKLQYQRICIDSKSCCW
uniref:Uncharacterized protein n=1 Tax=Anguilla anguilla TaxID=7936 RepID=A0A0E9R4Z6_ANGAN